MSKLTKYPNCEVPCGPMGNHELHDVYLVADVERAITELVSALRDLHDVQNGSPLPKYDRDWKAAMGDTERLLAEWEKQP